MYVINLYVFIKLQYLYYIPAEKRITYIYIYIHGTSKELHGLKWKRKTERDTAVEKTNAREIINIIPKSTALQKPTPPAPRVPTSTHRRRPRRAAEFYIIPISCSAIQRRSELKSIYMVCRSAYIPYLRVMHSNEPILRCDCGRPSVGGIRGVGGGCVTQRIAPTIH